MTYKIKIYKCSCCGKTSTENTRGWIELLETDRNSFYNNVSYYDLCPKCRANILGSLTKFTPEVTTSIIETDGWTYKNANELTWEPQYQENLTSIRVNVSGITTYTGMGQEIVKN